MAIEYNDSTVTINRIHIAPGSEAGAFDILGAFLDSSASGLHVISREASNESNIYRRRIDLSNPLVPTSADWLISGAIVFDSSDTEDVLKDRNILYYDSGSDTVWQLALQTGVFGVTNYNLGSGQVNYADKKITGIEQTRSIYVSATHLFILAFNMATSKWEIRKYPLAGLSYSTTVWGAALSTLTEHTAPATVEVIAAQNLSGTPVGMHVTFDGNLLVFYDGNNIAEKYSAADLSYLGVSAWAASDIGSMFNRNGFTYTLNDIGSSENLSLVRWLDKSTGVISQAKSIYTIDDRVIYINEAGYATLEFKARDEFGAPIPSLVGKFARFEVVTSRGPIDSNDLALSATTSNFRDPNGVPLNRSIPVAFDANGVATIYIHASRTSESFVVVDRVRVTYPA